MQTGDGGTRCGGYTADWGTSVFFLIKGAVVAGSGRQSLGRLPRSISFPGRPEGKASGDSIAALTDYRAPTLGKACHANAAGSWGNAAQASRRAHSRDPRRLETGVWEGQGKASFL